MRIMISGGGTGGGVYPALAVAAALRSRPHPPIPSPHRGEGEKTVGAKGPSPLRSDIEILWIGSPRGPERELVTREGIAFESVPSGPLAGVGLRALLTPFKIAAGTLKALMLVRRFQPDALLITGGWVTIPPALACWLSRVPVMIYMPDVEPGGTIKALSRIAARVGITAPESARYFRPGQAVETGYPLRAELLQAAGCDPEGQPLAARGGSSALSRTRAEARQRFDLAEGAPVLLVLGGSTGARSISRALVANLSKIAGDWQVVHLVGQRDWAWVQEAAAGLPAETREQYHPYEYLHSDDMALALAAADLALSRAGASVLGEFPLFGLPAILVPYPYAWRYQKTNADRLVSGGAAIRVDDARLPEELSPLLARLHADAGRQRMAAAAGALRRPDAAARLANELVDLARRHASQ